VPVGSAVPRRAAGTSADVSKRTNVDAELANVTVPCAYAAKLASMHVAIRISFFIVCCLLVFVLISVVIG
jgi:hypothetical protein